MAVSKCSHCRCPFWNYAPAPVPRGYCSRVCFDARKKKGEDPKYIDEQAVVSIVSEMRKHYLEVHGTLDLTEWFDCEECMRLDRRKIESLAEVGVSALKTFYFICRDCNRRKPMKLESIRPGLCKTCYEKRCDLAEREFPEVL